MYPGYNVIINTILAFVRLRNSICSQFKAGPAKTNDLSQVLLLLLESRRRQKMSASIERSRERKIPIAKIRLLSPSSLSFRRKPLMVRVPLRLLLPMLRRSRRWSVKIRKGCQVNERTAGPARFSAKLFRSFPSLSLSLSLSASFMAKKSSPYLSLLSLLSLLSPLSLSRRAVQQSQSMPSRGERTTRPAPILCGRTGPTATTAAIPPSAGLVTASIAAAAAAVRVPSFLPSRAQNVDYTHSSSSS